MYFCETDRTAAGVFDERRGGGRVSGFTLIEIVTAIAVFAVLVTIVLGSLKFILNRSSTMEEGITVYEEARQCLDRITSDLRAVYVSVEPGYAPPDLDDDPDPYRFFCEAALAKNVRLEFTAFSHLPLGGGIPTRAGKIAYYLEETETDGRVLMRHDEALQTGDSSRDFFASDRVGTDPVLCRHVKELNITCFDRDGGEYDSWDSDSADFSYATPTAVRIRLEIDAARAPYRFETMISLPVFRKPAEEKL